MPDRHDHWIAGKSTAPVAGDYLPSTSPTTGEIVAEVPRGTAPDVDAAARSARDSQRAWAARTPAERAGVLLAIAASMRAAVTELADLEAAETGKIAPRYEIEAAAEYFSYYGAVVRALAGESLDLGPGSVAFTRRQPYGVVGVITPWNGPLNQACRDVAPALAVGNAVVLKPSEFTSTSSLALGRLASECGLPEGVLNVVTGLGPEAGAALVDHEDVRKIAFTGSVATGRAVAAAAARRIVPVTLELGGKSPSVVFADADLDRAARAVAQSFTANTGQVCAANTRLIVERSAHDEVVRRVAEIVRGLEPGTRLGPLITEPQFAKVKEYFGIAEAEGATLVTGGQVRADGDLARGYFVEPTVYTDVRPETRIAQEEIFGPVLSVLAFDDGDEEAAVALANGVEFGLVASVWTRDGGRALRVAERLEAGQVAVNGGALGVETPFGGFKQSGIGRVKGVEALHTYTQLKTISIGTTF
ncbi:aldehyde dehydrogenase family protein [Pseudofrankia asymbiotica]|uniref:Aldehyde dehydrogenase n=1 Tax=Pseudofrankia asymbiotica TaxID=1834516 RepID=A0A1V2I2L4_9ACTN|nr:aldehyde dehydrogenase family protein [Pseudofrankia asymbiotica]ONH22880.1 aldehyde dehydrogenase [Pseudofrankia asymbiotica]